MKRILLFILASIITSYQAQSLFNRAYHNAGDYGASFFIEIDGEYYININKNFSSGTPYMYKLDANGNLKFKKPGVSGVVSSLRTYDNKLMTLSTVNWCDVYPGYDLAYIVKLDTNGNTLFSAIDTISSYGFTNALLQYSDSGYYFFSDNSFYRHNKNGQFVSSGNLGMNYITAAIELPNHNILLSAKQNSVSSLVIISASGAIVNVKPFPESIFKFDYYGGQNLIGLGASRILYKFSPGLNLISQSLFPNFLLASNFVVKNDSIYTTLANSGQSNYAIVDTAFNMVHLANNNVQDLFFTQVIPSVNKVALYSCSKARTTVGMDGDALDYYSAFSMINKFSSPNSTTDLALLSVSVDSLFYNGFQGPVYGSAVVGTVYLRPRAKLKNTGTTVINDLNLNSYEYLSFDGCSKHYFQEHFSNLNLLPGDSIQISASQFAFKNYANLVGGNVLSAQFCFYITVPNGDVDKTLSDNQICNDFNFVVTGLDESTSLTNDLNVFPNPSESDFTIKSSVTLNSVEVYNVIGQLISRDKPTEREIKIGNKLNTGVYFLKINTDKGTITRKIVKD